MEIKLNYIDAYLGSPASIIDLIVSNNYVTFSETITNLSNSEVDDDFISHLREIADELEIHNNKIRGIE